MIVKEVTEDRAQHRADQHKTFHVADLIKAQLSLVTEKEKIKEKVKNKKEAKN